MSQANGEPEDAGNSEEFAALLDAARAKDPEAIEALFQRFYERVQEMVHRDLAFDMRRNRPWLATRFSTGDVVQEVFRNLLRDLDGFVGQTEDGFCGYLAMVVRNRLIDAIRYHEAAQRDGRRTAAMAEDLNVSGSERDPATLADSLDEAARFAEIVAELPEREQLLLRARLEDEVGFEELAERLGYSSKWAARRAFYAVQADVAVRFRRANPTEDSQ